MKIQISLLAFGLLFAPHWAFAEPVEIIVADAAGAPVAGAAVQVEVLKFGAAVQVEVLKFDDEDGRVQTLTVAQSDAAGVAKFDLQPIYAGGDYFGRAVAFKEGLALGGVELRGGKRAIQLAAPIAATGTVRDENGAPVVGAKVELQGMRPTPDEDSLLFYFERKSTVLAPAIETRTDENGRWQLGSIAPKSTVYVHIEALDLATTDADFNVAEAPLETVLRPGARVRGRLFKPDGTPLTGTEISPGTKNGAYIRPITTDAQGSFLATGLSEDKWYFSIDLKNNPYVVGDLASLDLKVGDNQLPPITLQNGVVVRGTVRDTDGTPIKMSVTTNLPGQANTKTARTDAEGNFSLRVPAGERSFNLQPYDTKFRDTNKAKTLQIAAGDTPQIEWVLERLPVVRGVVTDEAGAPVRAPFVFSTPNSMSLISGSFETGEDGRFETSVDINGAARVLGRVDKDGRQYEIVGDNRLNLPAKTEIKLVARLAKPTIFRARAVDSDGQPLAGVTFEAMAWSDTSGQNLRLRSDENGEIQSENLGVGARLQGAVAALEGYDQSAPIEIVKEGENWTAKPIVLARRDAGLSGTIVGADGQAAADALVFAGGRETKTDANGAWTLKNLPPGDLLVSALSADGRSFAAGRAPLDAPLQLEVAPLVAGDKVLAQSILDDLRADAKNTDYPLKDKLRLPAGEKLGFVERIKSANGDPNSSAALLFYQLRNATDGGEDDALASETTQAVLDGWQAIDKQTDRLSVAAALMEARPDWKDAAGASDFVFRLEEDVNDELAGKNAENRKFRVEGLFALAAALETQGQTESADRALKNALDWTFAIPDSDNMGELGRDALLARGVGAFANAPRLFEKLLNYFDPESYWHHRAIGDLIAPTARARGLAAAVPIIERLRDLPDSRPAKVQGDEMPYVSARALPRLVEGAIRAGGQKEPELALKLASELKFTSMYGEENPPNRALIEAAFWQKPDVAAEIWREQMPRMYPNEALQNAIRIKAVNEDLARELYADARTRLERKQADNAGNFNPNYAEDAEFAYDEAQFAPARARYRLEKAWPDTLKRGDLRYRVNNYVLAMARLDPQRALEMAREIPQEKGFSSFDARYSLARSLADVSERYGVYSR